MTDEMAMRLLHATREQLHGKPTREVEPFEIAKKADINPYSREFDTAIRYLLDHGYIEHYPNEAVTALGLYRVTNKGLEEIISNPFCTKSPPRLVLPSFVTLVTFLWYDGFAGDGLRSDGVDDLPLSTSVCSILPIARYLRAGEGTCEYPRPAHLQLAVD